MPPSDLDIAQTAHQWIALHGDAATAKAREMVEPMRKKDDKDGADVWLRIIVAIGMLGGTADPASQAEGRGEPLKSTGSASDSASMTTPRVPVSP